MISIHPEVWLNFNHRLKESALVYSGEQGCFQWSAKGRPRLFINILKSQTPKWHNERCIVSAASTLRQSNQEVSSWGSVKGKLPQIPAVLLWSHFFPVELVAGSSTGFLHSGCLGVGVSLPTLRTSQRCVSALPLESRNCFHWWCFELMPCIE